MVDLSRVLKKPQGKIRCLLAIVLILGCIGSTPGLQLIFVQGNDGRIYSFSFRRILQIDIATGGGALVAFALLFNGTYSQGTDAEIAGLIFTGIYLILDLIAFISVVEMVSNYDFSGNIGFYILLISLGTALILWLLDFIMCAKDVFVK